MKTERKQTTEQKWNNLGQPKVFTNGVTWPCGIPSSQPEGAVTTAAKKAKHSQAVTEKVESTSRPR